MNIAYWDLSCGVTPRMMLGALVSAGLRANALRKTIRTIFGSCWKLNVKQPKGQNDNEWCAWIDIRDLPAQKTTRELLAEMTRWELPRATEERAREVLYRVTGSPEDANVFHLPTAEWAETLCVLLGYEALSIEQSCRSHFSVGTEADTETLRILEGHRIQPCPHRHLPLSQLGVSLMLTLAPAEGDLPIFPFRNIGLGHDSRSPASETGTLRLFVGTLPSVSTDELVYQVEATIDDMNPEFYPTILSSLRRRGALDTWWTAVVTRNGRPGATVTALVSTEILPVILEAILEETTTIGVRFHRVARRILPRREYEAETSLGIVRIKESTLPSGKTTWKAELEDCLRLSDQTGLPVKEVQAIVNLEIEEKRSSS